MPFCTVLLSLICVFTLTTAQEAANLSRSLLPSSSTVSATNASAASKPQNTSSLSLDPTSGSKSLFGHVASDVSRVTGSALSPSAAPYPSHGPNVTQLNTTTISHTGVTRSSAGTNSVRFGLFTFTNSTTSSATPSLHLASFGSVQTATNAGQAIPESTNSSIPTSKSRSLQSNVGSLTYLPISSGTATISTIASHADSGVYSNIITLPQVSPGTGIVSMTSDSSSGRVVSETGGSGTRDDQTPTNSLATTSIDPSTFDGGVDVPATTPAPNELPAPQPSGKLSSLVEVEVDKATYLLPRTGTFDLLKDDGSVITLAHDRIVSGSATLTIPPLSGATELRSAGLSVKAQPATLGQQKNKGGLNDVFSAFKSLINPAKSIVEKGTQIADLGAKWAAGGADNAFEDAAKHLIDDVADSTAKLARDMVLAAGDIELGEMGQSGPVVDEGLEGVCEASRIMTNARTLLRSRLASLRRGVTNTMKRDWFLIAGVGGSATSSFAVAVLKMKKFSDDRGIQGAVESSSASASASSSSSAKRSTLAVPFIPKGSPTRTTTASSSVETAPTRTTTQVSSESESASPAPTMQRYIIDSAVGTSSLTFKNFIETIDGGAGQLNEVEGFPQQSYITSLTKEQAKKIARNEIVDLIGLYGEEPEDSSFGALPPQPDLTLRKRAPVLDRTVPQLKLISQPKDSKNRRNREMPEYGADSALGKGQTIYVLDTGYRKEHVDFQNRGERSIDSYIVPNKYTLIDIDRDLWCDEDDTDHGDFKPATNIVSYHGTWAASVAAGAVHGVAPKADLVNVKFRNAHKNADGSIKKVARATPAALRNAFWWVIGDIERRKRINGNTGKFIINMSYGFTDPITRERIEKLTKLALSLDIVVVIPAGNDGLRLGTPRHLEDYSPQNLGRASNDLITVGGTDEDGNYFKPTTPRRRQTGGWGPGSITVYAQAHMPIVASGPPDTSLDATQKPSGTSFAAPAIAGLAAYFFSIEALNDNWHAGSIPKNMKDYIVAKSWLRQDDPMANAWPPADQIPGGATYRPPWKGSVQVAWNGWEGDECSQAGPAPKRRRLNPLGSMLTRRQSGHNESTSACSARSLSSASFSETSATQSSSLTLSASTTQTSSLTTSSSAAAVSIPAPKPTTPTMEQFIVAGYLKIVTPGAPVDKAGWAQLAVHHFNMSEIEDYKDHICSDENKIFDPVGENVVTPTSYTWGPFNIPRTEPIHDCSIMGGFSSETRMTCYKDSVQFDAPCVTDGDPPWECGPMQVMWFVPMHICGVPASSEGA